MFGFRFGKKKDEKKEAKAALQRQKSDLLSDVELERMKEERERWVVSPVPCLVFYFCLFLLSLCDDGFCFVISMDFFFLFFDTKFISCFFLLSLVVFDLFNGLLLLC